MKILVCGSRDWSDVKAIEKVLVAVPKGALLIHGDNGYDSAGKALWGKPDELAVKGADKLAGAAATRLGMSVKRYTPDWSKGRAAGPIRNRAQAKEKPDVLIVFHADVFGAKKGSGTKSMVQIALEEGIKHFVIVRSADTIDKLSAEEVAQLLK
jgi:hypothetical protein